MQMKSLIRHYGVESDCLAALLDAVRAMNPARFMSTWVEWLKCLAGVWSPTRPSVIFLGLVSGGFLGKNSAKSAKLSLHAPEQKTQRIS